MYAQGHLKNRLSAQIYQLADIKHRTYLMD